VEWRWVAIGSGSGLAGAATGGSACPTGAWLFQAWLFQERAVVFGIETVAFHLAGQVGAQRLGGTAHPGGDDGLYADAIFAVLFRHGFGQGAQFGCGGFAYGPRSLGYYQIQEIFGCIVPIHRFHCMRVERMRALENRLVSSINCFPRAFGSDLRGPVGFRRGWPGRPGWQTAGHPGRQLAVGRLREVGLVDLRGTKLWALW
jgi:hypothetical protein